MWRGSGAAIILVLALLAAAAVRWDAVSAGVPQGAEQVVHITAKRFEYTPNDIHVKKGLPVVLELTAEDREHGFRLRAFGVRAELKPGRVTRVSFVPDRTGIFPFECDVFCGSGHEDMAGQIVVVD